MNITLKLTIIVLLLLQLILIIRITKKRKMTLKYASFWLMLIFIMIVITIFPKFIFQISKITGFEKTSNMIFLIGFFFLFYISVTISTTISIQSEKIRLLTQEVSLLKKRVSEDGKKE